MGWEAEPSVWAIDEWDPNSWDPPGDVTWLRDHTTDGGQAEWWDPSTGHLLTWTGEDGHGSGQLTLAAA